MELVSLRTAKLAKKKGFNENCRDGYDNNGCLKDVHRYLWRFFTNNSEISKNIEDGKMYFKKISPNREYEPDFICTTPTQSQLQKWLRDKHFINVIVDAWANGKYICKIINKNGNATLVYDKLDNNLKRFASYENALEEGLQEALLLI